MIHIFKSVRKVFITIFYTVIAITLVLLILLFFVYSQNTQVLKTQMESNTQHSIIKLRDLMAEYIRNKILLLANDIIPIISTFETLYLQKDLEKYYPDLTPEYINETCVFPSNDVPKIPLYQDGVWWKLNETVYLKRRYGVWFFGNQIYHYDALNQKNRRRLLIKCIMKDFLFGIIEKNKYWDKWMNVTVMKIYFTYSDGFHVMYPLKFASYLHLKDTNFIDKKRRTNCTTHPINVFYPKCRPYFLQALEETTGFIITPPYEWADSTFGMYINIFMI